MALPLIGAAIKFLPVLSKLPFVGKILQSVNGLFGGKIFGFAQKLLGGIMESLTAKTSPVAKFLSSILQSAPQKLQDFFATPRAQEALQSFLSTSPK
jgi:hypothetical protein